MSPRDVARMSPEKSLPPRRSPSLHASPGVSSAFRPSAVCASPIVTRRAAGAISRRLALGRPRDKRNLGGQLPVVAGMPVKRRGRRCRSATTLAPWYPPPRGKHAAYHERERGDASHDAATQQHQLATQRRAVIALSAGRQTVAVLLVRVPGRCATSKERHTVLAVLRWLFPGDTLNLKTLAITGIGK